MNSLCYYTLDVFTSRPFGGNPLAVFADAEGLDSALMQQIARELNLSETVFVGQNSSPDRFAVRIFTPEQEIPFAGHPTVGTALLLNHLGRLSGDRLVLEEQVGDVAVSLITDNQSGALSARFRTARLPEIEPSPLTRRQAARLLGLEEAQVATTPFSASCGLPFQMVELNDVDAVAAATLEMGLWKQLLADSSAPDIYLFCRKAGSDNLRARMFAPASGIPEDPATGSAASALAGALAAARPEGSVQPRLIEQGIEMGRPSHIHTEVHCDNGQLQAIYVTGEAVVISRGEFLLPAN